MTKQSSFREPSRRVPVTHEVDVLVVGAGSAGVCAAIRAAREGARTLLVDTEGYLGGTWTAGMQTHVTSFHDGRRVIVKGIVLEIMKRLARAGGAEDPTRKFRPDYFKEKLRSYWVNFNHEMLKGTLDDMATEAGARLLLHTRCVGAMVRKNLLQGVIVENKSGRQAIRAKVTIDCSGDADVAFLAGAPTAQGRARDGKCQPPTTTFLLLNANLYKGGAWLKQHPGYLAACEKKARARGELTLPTHLRLGTYSCLPRVSYHNITRILGVDATRAADLTRGEIEGRKQVREVVAFYRKYVPGFEQCRLLATSSSLGLRESRRIVGEYTMDGEDVMAARHFPDGIARHRYYIDMHSPDGGGTEEDAGMSRVPPPGSHYEVPYRCLVPKKIEQLLVAGRCVSSTREALGSLRTTACCAQMGEAAGLAAAIAVRRGKTVRGMDGRVLKKRLLGGR